MQLAVGGDPIHSRTLGVALRWRSRDAAVADLVGLGLRARVATQILGRLSGDPTRRPMLDALLQLAPAAQQCLAGLSGAWQVAARRSGSESAAGVGSFPDSCYMWRRGGALDALRSAAPGSTAERGPGEG